MAKAAKIITLSTGICLLLFVVIATLSADRWVYRTQFKQSYQLIEAIDAFRLNENRWPTEQEVDSLKVDLGLPTQEKCPCYQLESEDHFIVWFGYQSTGSSMVYDSQTAEWAPRH